MDIQSATDELECVICMGSSLDLLELFPAPCGIHFVCRDDIVNFFRQAVQQESMYPPACCEQVFEHRDYEQFLPLLLSIQYRLKQTGEYSVLPKCATTEPTKRYFYIPGQPYLTWLFRDRTYCAIPTCSNFLHPRIYITELNITYAPCICTQNTCTKCKHTLTDPATHVCTEDPDTTEFMSLAAKKGYKTCPNCGAVIELREACNHITYVSASEVYSRVYPLTNPVWTGNLTVKRCTCSTEFCYICGSLWEGLHGCPTYGPPRLDTEGYNQDGFHHVTGINRDGMNRQEAIAQLAIGADGDELDDEDIEINHIINGAGDLGGFNGMLWRLAAGDQFWLEAGGEEDEDEVDGEVEDEDVDEDDEEEDDSGADDADDEDEDDDDDEDDEDDEGEDGGGGGEGLESLWEFEEQWEEEREGEEGEEDEEEEEVGDWDGDGDDEEEEEEEGYEEYLEEEEDGWEEDGEEVEEVEEGDAMEVDAGAETNHAPDMTTHERLMREWAEQDREI